MNKKKFLIAVSVSVLCILLNIGGKALASALELPMMLDTFGTMLCAYIYGPVSGAIVGAATNIAYYAKTPIYAVYAISNVAAGIIVGICAKKKFLEKLFGILSSAMLVTVTSVAVSTPLNIIFFGGRVSNKWADGVIGLLETLNANKYFAYFCGEFYLDFVDKLLTLFAMVLVIRLYRSHASKHLREIVSGLLTISLSLAMCVIVPPAQNARADEAAVTSQASQAAEASGDAEAPQAPEAAVGVQKDTYLRTVYNSENGLPGGTVNDIAQTKDGVLWIGTYGGLYRYNGSSFRLMNNFKSVKAVNCFFTDEEGRLWIGTNESGISICINNEISNVLNAENGLPSDSVRSIAQGSGGHYYVGTSDALAVVTLANGLRVIDVISEITYAKSISTSGNYAAVVADNGMLYLLEGTKIIDRSPRSVYGCCRFDEDGTLYAGTGEGNIDVFDVTSGSLTETGQKDCGELGAINSINPIRKSDFIIICAENGAGYLKSGVYSDINVGKFSSSIDHTIIDYQGNLWLTSSRLGLLKLCRSPFSEIYTTMGLEPAVVNAICEWHGVLYFGTDSGIDAVNSELTQIVENKITKAAENYRVRSIMTDSTGKLWICTAANGTMCVNEKMKITNYNFTNGAISNRSRSTIETSSGDILIASDMGITCIRDGSAAYTLGEKDGFATPKVLCMLETPRGDILAGTDGSGIAVIRNEKIVDVLDKKDGLSSNVIMRIVADRDGSGYYIVSSNSLSFMDNDYNIRVLTNFPYFNNYDVVENDDGMLFVLSSAGIYAVDKHVLLDGGSEYILLDYSRGFRMSLSANSWNYVDGNDNLFLSGDSGVVCLDLNNYTLAPGSYRISLPSIQVDYGDYFSQDGETFHIPRGSSRVVISPDIANYSLTDPYISLYLEGFEKNKTITSLSGMTHKVYTNLPTGTYRFHVAILDEKGGVAAENTYTVVKDREIYDEWWFMVYVWAVLICIIIYIAWLTFRLHIQPTLNIQKRELEVAKKQIEMGNEAIMTIARTVDAKDMNTSQHSFRVSEYAVMIAKRLGFDDEQCEELRKTALLHDIGKIGIPDSVLNKPAKLTDEEYTIMKTHVAKGAEILENFTSVKNIVEGAKYHHERYDGRGYMEGLKGEEIPINARIIGIADAFDAMTANRVYRKQLEIDFVLHELQRCRGTQFDPKLTDILLALIDEGTIDVEKLYEESREAPERRIAR